MRKTLNINLGGMAFIIDENAFELLYNYLETLKRKFNNEAERDEIINDIEARLAELLSQKMGNRKEVLSIEEVSYVIGLMGKPEDIAGDEPGAEAEGTTTWDRPVGADDGQPRLWRPKIHSFPSG